MSARPYPWTRYWQKLGEQPLAPANGYLPDFSDEISRAVHPEFRTLTDLDDVQCLVLLGEPGLGKTTAIEEEIERLRRQGQTVDFHDLKAYGDTAHLLDRIFGTKPFTAPNDSPLTVVMLDSLDEGRIAIKNIEHVLGNELSIRLKDERVRSRIRVRITCRSAEWPSSLTERLRAAFGDNNVELWHLMQLRRLDVQIAAQKHQIDPPTFLQEVESANAEPLAIKPVTLELLLMLKSQRGALPSKQVELYELGLECLSAEPNRQRIDSGSEQTVGRLTAAHRLEIAQRIAGLSILCQCPFMQLVDSPSLSDSGTLSPSSVLSSEWRSTSGDGLVFEPKDIRETLKGGIFRTAGTNRVTWMHQTYAEFLAARYLLRGVFETKQLDALLRSTDAADPRIIPQLGETAAWLASMKPQFRNDLLATDPEVLLRSDLISSNDDLKSALASRLLEAVKKREINDDGLDRYLVRLSSSSLTKVIRAWLDQPQFDFHATRVALKIARECRIEGLNDKLDALARDEAMPAQIRRLAIEAMAPFCTKEQRVALRPLLDVKDDELQVTVLKLLWPSTISTTEMLASLRPPNDSVVGHHDYFIRHELVTELPDTDLPVALIWMAEHLKKHPRPSRPEDGHDGYHRSYNFRELFETLHVRAVGQAHREEIASALAAAVAALIKAPDWLWETSRRSSGYREIPADNEVRRAIALKVISLVRGSHNGAVGIIWEVPYIVPEDFDWLLTGLSSITDPAERSLVADILWLLRDKDSVDQFERLYDLCEQCAEFAERQQTLTGYVEIDSPTANYLRESHNREDVVDDLPKKIDPKVVQFIITKLLLDLKNGEHPSWWKLLQFLGHEDDGRLSEATHKSSLTSLPRWRHVEPVSGEIRKYAIDFLANADLHLDRWWPDKGVFYWPAWAGYRALDHFLDDLDDDVGVLMALEPALWAKWAPAIIAIHMTDEERLGRGGQLSRLCLDRAPEAYHRRIREMLEFQTVGGKGRISFRWYLKGAWDHQIGDLVSELVSKETIDLETLHEGLWLMLEHNHPASKTLVTAATQGTVTGERQIRILSTAIRHDHGKKWSELWPVLEQDQSLGFAVLCIAATDDFLNEMTALSDAELASLYLYLFEIWKSNRKSSPNFRLPRDVDWMHNAIPRALSERATLSSLAALLKIRDASEELQWISHSIVECRQNMRRTTWTPPTPTELLRLGESKERRFVRSERDLLGVIRESVERFQKRLFGSQPAIGDIWNTVRGHYRPKEENEITDVIVRFLRDDLVQRGIVTNREVEVRPARGGSSGSRTDIHVDAIRREVPNDTLRAVVEVKGCWHPELSVAMRSQLVDAYLGDTGISAGVYLVCWFLCPIWEKRDRRKIATERLGWRIEDAEDFFRLQAAELTGASLLLRHIVLDGRWPNNGSKRSGGKKRQRKKA
jgi:hypothetical protein